MVRSLLHRLGYRFRLHGKLLPGKPDIVLPKYHAVVFVHGCFWHRHENCADTTTPKTNTEFWEEKFQRNVNRDLIAQQALKQLGWKIVIVWGCELKNPKSLSSKLLDALV